MRPILAAPHEFLVFGSFPTLLAVSGNTNTRAADGPDEIASSRRLRFAVTG
jgi:hypothetical protein